MKRLLYSLLGMFCIVLICPFSMDLLSYLKLFAVGDNFQLLNRKFHLIAFTDLAVITLCLYCCNHFLDKSKK